jgi:hypothetical protein
VVENRTEIHPLRPRELTQPVAVRPGKARPVCLRTLVALLGRETPELVDDPVTDGSEASLQLAPSRRGGGIVKVCGGAHGPLTPRPLVPVLFLVV